LVVTVLSRLQRVPPPGVSLLVVSVAIRGSTFQKKCVFKIQKQNVYLL